MNVFDVFGQSFWRQLVFALLHTVWQGGLIALATAAALRYLPAKRSGARYVLSLLAQSGVLIAGLLTWAALGYEPPKAVSTVTHGLTSDAGTVTRAFETMTSPTPAELPETRGPADWVAIAAVVWLAGVGVMTVRAGASALAASRLTRGAAAVDRAIVEAVESLRRELGIVRKVRVVSCERAPGPAAFGMVWPTVVLPVSMLTGLSPEAIRAILAHELAHVRRHDYAINLAQMAVEALLFFNPAVWWLGRQVRVEREACCDAVAVRLSGGPLEYSKVLADWAERVRGSFATSEILPGAAMAWAREARPSTLRERVLRVLRPGDTPRSRVSWTGLVVLLVAGPLVLLAMRRGANEAVALAAQVLSPAERVEKLKEAKAEYAPPEIQGEGKATLKGTLRAPGGKPLTKPVQANVMTRAGNGSYGASLNPLGETFSVEVRAGRVWLSLVPEGFAPATAGPFDVAPGGTVEGINVVFEEGFPARVRVVDENGKPVVGATVNGGLMFEGSGMYGLGDLVSDADGRVTLAHVSRRRFTLTARAKGFQTFGSREAELSPDEVTTLTLVHARPTSGVVVAPDGSPVAGAKIRPYVKYRFQNSQQFSASEPAIGTTDKDGRFRLEALDDDATYALLVESDRQGRRLMTGVKAGQEGLKWTVGPKLTISGTIKGDISTLEKDRGKPFVVVTEVGQERPDATHIPTVSANVPVEPAEGGGRFTVSSVLPGNVTLRVGNHVVTLDAKTPDNAVTIDLTKPASPSPTRTVIIRVVIPTGLDEAKGSIVGYVSGGRGESVFRAYERPLKGGEVRLEAPTPGQISYRPNAALGYWFTDGSAEVPPGDTPLVIEVKAVPAGAIVGRVFDADGKPAVDGVSLGISTVEKPPGFKPADFIQLNNVRVDGAGRFFLGPLPVGGTYVAVAGKGHNRQAGNPVRLDESKATQRDELKLSKVATGSGRVVGPDGRPLSGVAVSLQLNHPRAGTSWSPPSLTDRDGRFQFDDLGTELNDYRVTIDSRKDYQPTEAGLTPGGPPIEIRLEKGRVVTGRVVDAATGWPIPGVEMYAARKVIKPGLRNGFDAEGLTDEQGRFRFSNLPAVDLQLNDRAGLRWEESGGVREIAAGRTAPVEIRATLPGWSKLKPTSP